MHGLTIADHIFFAFIAFVLPLLVLWRQQPNEIRIPQDSDLKIRIYWLNCIVLWVGAIIVIGLWFFGGRSFGEVGFRMPDPSAFPHWLLVVSIFLLYYYLDTAFSWISDEVHPASAILPANWREFAHFGTVVSISAACCEEIVFRGFLVTYLLVLLDGSHLQVPVAIVGSSFVFGIVHMYQGWTALLKIALLSLLFALLFVLTKSLLLVILLHFAVDFTSGVLAVVRTQHESRRRNAYWRV